MVELKTKEDIELFRYAIKFKVPCRINPTETVLQFDSLDRMRDFLNDYCRAKIDAANHEGPPLWVGVADKAQERRP